ncbi:TadE/TadG family type IV pilus assembly protein [Achromobacter aloeverae]|uniref:Pilus assembly protein n=1 Tax=Achromobacter aloeverae TaxID=1750518 RepID=A0A4Q1HQI5_9BURK|nr:TadE/TadG family type IV pilus assembly protein [Achromobacter aloeverae]RXN93219.1 pilus assembly protein [Achromobacter aloeverae]
MRPSRDVPAGPARARQRAVARHGPRAQHGLAALEFALVLSAFLLLFGGIVGLGGVMWAQQKLTGAATEGARAVLDSGLNGAVDMDAACKVAREAATWMAVGCAAAPRTCAWPGGTGGAAASCAAVTLTYSTADWPLLSLVRALSQALGVSTWVPRTLTANAVVQIQEAL